MLVIEIPQPTPSLNYLRKLHFCEYKRLRDQFTTIFRTSATEETRCKPNQLRRITISRFAPRRLDHDNFVGGCKPLVDALNLAGLIWNDDPNSVDIDYRQIKCKTKDAKTMINIDL